MRLPLAASLAVLTLTASLSGCLSGAFSPATVSGQLPAGWQLDTQNGQGGSEGNALATVRYQLNVYDTTDSSIPQGALGVVAVNSVPLIDVQGEIKKKMDEWVSEQQISLTPTGSGSTSIQGNKADYTVFDATKQVSGTTVHGRAIDVKYTCGGNGEAIRLFGFAATEKPSFPLGSMQHDTSTWTTIVGADPPATPAGGFLGRVVCSA
jgi:hypothetical protein